MMNFDLAVMTVLYWGRFLEEQRDADIPTQYWAILPEENKQGGWEDIFENPPGIFRFLTLPMEIPDKTRLHP